MRPDACGLLLGWLCGQARPQVQAERGLSPVWGCLLRPLLGPRASGIGELLESPHSWCWGSGMCGAGLFPVGGGGWLPPKSPEPRGHMFRTVVQEEGLRGGGPGHSW